MGSAEAPLDPSPLSALLPPPLHAEKKSQLCFLMRAPAILQVCLLEMFFWCLQTRKKKGWQINLFIMHAKKYLLWNCSNEIKWKPVFIKQPRGSETTCQVLSSYHFSERQEKWSRRAKNIFKTGKKKANQKNQPTSLPPRLTFHFPAVKKRYIY